MTVKRKGGRANTCEIAATLPQPDREISLGQVRLRKEVDGALLLRSRNGKRLNANFVRYIFHRKRLRVKLGAKIPTNRDVRRAVDTANRLG